MDTQHLHAFVAVAETGSFSAAGQRLHLTQPAISKRIATLELQLGSPLFDRVGRQISLTQAGQSLLPNAKRILREVADAERAVADLQGEVRGTLSMATSHHIGLHRLPPALRHFTERYPEVKLDLHFLDSEQAYEEVLQGRYELGAVTLAPEPDTRIAGEKVWVDELLFTAAHNHPLAERETLELADLSPWQAIMPDAQTYTTRLVRELFDKQSQTLEINMVTNHLDTIKMMLSIGLGWGVLPQSLLGDGQLRVLNVQHPPLSRDLGMIYHRQRNLSNAARVFLQLVKGF
ncbi:LysR family transcriptional regulator [Marinimicrobium sp. ABcell2]|uniref:LysR family transcriptional regulator n=1 Tax=Marinimicrobium sp. ABcell2 TaxID=3069751 RepID=UPI0027B4962E|nr:LysR family transcriptional regulator [Marinimicrobium sp. ABcell2]MDQ2075526.1 LysR family transcriptional regulator [Marinimicrobium sp. ABcell2]